MENRTLLSAFEEEFQKTKKLSDGAIAQLDDQALHVRINPQQNSIALIVQHLAGNLQSRFTDFLTTDGEKPTRNRDGEFEDRNLPRPQLLQLWEAAWQTVFSALAPLTDADLTRIVYIRKEPHTVQKAIVRSIAHTAWHAGQIALIAKHLKGEGWKYLTTPPRGSAEFNRKMGV